ncbi:tetratricopeptide repeat protein [mine drainage metagenome]|uniref:Tetratricopeptide repeat protein n=1 Tax=mine drainage metagenome TaxID=410659 RepID=A0A1J5RGK2_9ZZZZ
MRLMRAILVPLLFSSLCAQAGNLMEVTQLYQNGKTEQALAALETYTASLPKDGWGRNVTRARFLKGVMLADLKRTDEAIQVFDRLTIDYPDLPEPYNNLAALYVSQGKYEAARDTLERAMHTDPTYASLHDNLSDVYARLSSHAYESTLHNTSGKAAPERIRELCENYGKMASQAAGRKIAPRADADFALLHDIPASRTVAAQPPKHLDVDEMAMENPAGHAAPAELLSGSRQKPVAAASAKHEPADHAPEETHAILGTVQAWSSAWSGKNVGSYLAHYAPDFKLPGGGTRAAWAARRRERISRPKSIRVNVEAPQVTLTDASHARVTFRQNYRSDSLQTNGRKTLLMVRSGGKWLIQEELAGG